jgi:hypothetical protein
LPQTERADTLGGMCRKMTCKACGKPSWAGCGAHVEQVLGDVPKAERCKCNETGARAASKKEKVTAGGPSRSPFASFFRKKK